MEVLVGEMGRMVSVHPLRDVARFAGVVDHVGRALIRENNWSCFACWISSVESMPRPNAVSVGVSGDVFIGQVGGGGSWLRGDTAGEEVRVARRRGIEISCGFEGLEVTVATCLKDH